MFSESTVSLAIFIYSHIFKHHLNDTKRHQMWNTNLNLSWKKLDILCIWTKTCDLSHTCHSDKQTHINIHNIVKLDNHTKAQSAITSYCLTVARLERNVDFIGYSEHLLTISVFILSVLKFLSLHHISQ